MNFLALELPRLSEEKVHRLEGKMCRCTSLVGRAGPPPFKSYTIK